MSLSKLLSLCTLLPFIHKAYKSVNFVFAGGNRRTKKIVVNTLCWMPSYSEVHAIKIANIESMVNNTYCVLIHMYICKYVW